MILAVPHSTSRLLIATGTTTSKNILIFQPCKWEVAKIYENCAIFTAEPYKTEWSKIRMLGLFLLGGTTSSNLMTSSELTTVQTAWLIQIWTRSKFRSKSEMKLSANTSSIKAGSREAKARCLMIRRWWIWSRWRASTSHGGSSENSCRSTNSNLLTESQQTRSQIRSVQKLWLIIWRLRIIKSLSFIKLLGG